MIFFAQNNNYENNYPSDILTTCVCFFFWVVHKLYKVLGVGGWNWNWNNFVPNFSAQGGPKSDLT